MRKNSFEQITAILILVGIILALSMVILSKDEPYVTTKMDIEMISFLLSFICIILATVSLIMTRRKNILNEKKETELLSKWIRYDKKRKEIEEEMSLLTKQLMASDVSKYIDINRLIIDAQVDGYKYNGEAINYSAFFNQFGLNSSEISVRKDSAIFLTPFDVKGEILFKQCQEILGKLDIFLRKSDNFVEKDDIMMNIVALIVQSEIVIVNINGRNPNVYYELGIAHALGKPTILLSEMSKPIEELGFDIRQKKIIMYHTLADLEEQLLYQVSRIKKRI